MVREHEELSEEYESLQKELNTLKSKLNHIDYFKWLEEELGYTLDKDTIVNYAKFEIKNELDKMNQKNKYTNIILDSCCLIVGIFLAVFLWGAFTHPISNHFIVNFIFDILILFGVTIVSLNVETSLVEKKHRIINIEHDNKKAYYLMQHKIPENLQRLIEYSLRKLHAYYYKGFNDNDLFETMYYVLYNKEDYMNE